MLWSDFELYLKPVHLKGRAHTVKIVKIEIEQVFNPKAKRKEPVPVCYFEKAQRGLVLGATKRKALAKLFGDDSTAALGQSVTLEPGTNEHGDETILIKGAST